MSRSARAMASTVRDSWLASGLGCGGLSGCHAPVAAVSSADIPLLLARPSAGVLGVGCQPLGHAEAHLECLPVVEPRIARRRVVPVEVRHRDSRGAPDALGHVLPRELEV